MRIKTRKYLGDYHRRLIKSLKNPHEAKAYLNVALEDDQPTSFLVALKNVVEAHGVSKTAKLSGLNRVSCYKILSKRGNPSLLSLHLLLRAVGLSLRVDETHRAASL